MYTFINIRIHIGYILRTRRDDNIHFVVTVLHTRFVASMYDTYCVTPFHSAHVR